MLAIEGVELYIAVAGVAATIIVGVWHADVRAASLSLLTRMRFNFRMGSKPKTMTAAAFVGALVIVGVGMMVSKNRPAVGSGQPLKASVATKPRAKADSTQERTVRGVRFVEIPAGANELGCCTGDPDCIPGELPLQRRTIDKPYWMAITETTRRQFATCVEAGACQHPVEGALVSYGDENNVPVTWVDAAEAGTFCRWLGGGLPTEVEWEYAARGGNHNQRYPWGNSVTREDARFLTSKPAGVATVASFPPNGYGLYDMAGNVAEWCLGPTSNDGRPFVIARGGSFKTPPDRIRVSARVISGFDFISDAIGFRCVVR